MNQLTTAQLELEQRKFEDWYRANYTTHIPMWNGEYQNGVVQIAWESWKAALSQKVSDIQPQAKLTVGETRQWISIEDRLPDDETPVLVVHNGEVCFGEIRWERPTYEETFTPFRYWDDPNNDGQDWEWRDVILWMPLPIVPAQQITDASIADKIDKFNSRKSDSFHVDKPTELADARLRALDAAFETEIVHVSRLGHNSNEICREFYKRLRKMFAIHSGIDDAKIDGHMKKDSVVVAALPQQDGAQP